MLGLSRADICFWRVPEALAEGTLITYSLLYLTLSPIRPVLSQEPNCFNALELLLGANDIWKNLLRHSKWVLEHCILMQALTILYQADITKFLQDLWIFSHLGVCILTLVLTNTHRSRTKWLTNAGKSCSCNHWSQLCRSCHYSHVSAYSDAVVTGYFLSLLAPAFAQETLVCHVLKSCSTKLDRF